MKATNNQYFSYIGLFLFLTTSSNLLAQSWSDRFNFNGFYTLDLTVTDANLPVISASQIMQFKKHDFSFGNSLLGGQLSYDFTNALSTTIQASLSLDNRGSVDFNLDWGYLSYQFNNNWTARSGRFQVPILQGTELSRVGFTRLWARKLTPGSGAGGYDHYDGIEVLKQVTLNDSSIDFQWGLGQAKHDLENQHFNKNIQVFSAKYQKDQFWLRGALLYGRYRVTTPRGALITDSGEVLMGSIEGEWNHNDWLTHFGTSSTRADIAPDDSMAYLSIGKQFNQFTPYVLSIYRNQYFEAFTPPRPPGVMPPIGPGGPPMPPDGDNDNYSLAIGLNWQLNSTATLKFQFEHIKLDDQARSQTGRVINEGNVLSIVLDGIF